MQTTRQDRAAARVEKHVAKLAEQRRLDDEYGEKVEDQLFGFTRVRLYAKGFTRVGVINPPYEELLSIEFDADVQKKRGLTRAAGFFATGGLNMLASNQRGDLYLTITTRLKTHALHVSPPSPGIVRAGKMLAARGQALLASPEPGHTVAAPETSSPVGLPEERLRGLAQLQRDGLLSEEEYEEARLRILRSL